MCSYHGVFPSSTMRSGAIPASLKWRTTASRVLRSSNSLVLSTSRLCATAPSTRAHAANACGDTFASRLNEPKVMPSALSPGNALTAGNACGKYDPTTFGKYLTSSVKYRLSSGGTTTASAKNTSIARIPVPVAYPHAVTWIGAGFCANTSNRFPAECPDRSTRMSIPSPRINSATAASVCPTIFLQQLTPCWNKRVCPSSVVLLE